MTKAEGKGGGNGLICFRHFEFGTSFVIRFSSFEFPPTMLPTIPSDVAPAWYYLCVGAAVLITGISKAGFGGGMGILAIPLMTLVVGGRQMLGIMLPLLILCDLFANAHHLGHYDWHRLRWLLPGLVVGILIGTGLLLLLRGQPPAQFHRILNGLVGSVCLAIVLLQVYRLTGREVPTLPPHPASATAVGVVAGGVSTLNQSAGPIVTVYLLQEKLEKRMLVGTLLLYFLIGNLLKLPTYLLLPMADGKPIITLDTLRDSIWFIPLIPMGTVFGAWMHHRVPEKPFAAIMYAAAAVAAAKLVWDAAS
jgi:hypothetical protein